MTDAPTKGSVTAPAKARAEQAKTARRVTMVEVAHAAGVSQTTVSFVLNDVKGARFTEETRERVLQAAQRIGYQTTRRRAATPAAGQGAIAYLCDEMSTDPWMALGLEGVREKASERGLVVHTIVTGGATEAIQAALNRLAAPDYVGVIFGCINLRRIDEVSFPRDLPTVLLNCYVIGHPLLSIIPAEVLGGRAATQRLIAAGHRRIGYINGKPWMDASRDRLKGYRRALAEADIAFDPKLVRDGNWEPSAGYEQTLALMALKNPPTAIFCANDMTAFGSYEALRELGLAIPRDVAVIGYDDREIATFLHPPLTTYLLPLAEMGAEAAECLFDHIGRAPSAAGQIKIEGKLIERSSV